MLTLKLRIIFIIIISPQSMEDYKKKSTPHFGFKRNISFSKLFFILILRNFLQQLHPSIFRQM